MKLLQIAVIGAAGNEEYQYAKPSQKMFACAETIGQLLGKANCIVVNGGKGGVMEAVCKGAKAKGGITVGEIASINRGSSNRYVDVEIVTGDLAFRGPSQLIGMCDAVIALGGGAGTLQELCIAYRLKKPVVLVTGFGGWTDKLANLDFLDERQLIRFTVAKTPRQAVKLVLSLVE